MLRSLPLGYYLALLLALGVANYTIYRSVLTPPRTTVSVFSAGKGTVALVRDPSGRTLLIDTGSDASILRDLGTALPYWQRSLDAVVLSSDKVAQTGGLPILQERYRVARLFSAGTETFPYGAPLMFSSDAFLTVAAPGIFFVHYGANVFALSSSTTPGSYASNGTAFIKR